MSEPLPKTQRAVLMDTNGQPYSIREDYPVPNCGPDQVMVKVLFSGLCHSDVGLINSEYPRLMPVRPVVAGHEGAGIVVRRGDHVKTLKEGDRVGLKFISSRCSTCEYCRRGFESNCTSAGTIGHVNDGTFQQYCAVQASEAIKIPDGISLEEAAPIFCAGLTVYKGLKETNVKSGQIVAIVGAGGGLGSLGIQYARAMGMRVLALDVSAKEEHCRGLGANLFIDPFKTEDLVADIMKLTDGGPHGVLNLAPSERATTYACDYVRTRGTVVLVALNDGVRLNVDAFMLIFRGITVKGSLLSNCSDVQEALEFVAHGLVKSPVEVVPFQKFGESFERVRHGKVNGRLVVNLWS